MLRSRVVSVVVGRRNVVRDSGGSTQRVNACSKVGLRQSVVQVVLYMWSCNLRVWVGVVACDRDGVSPILLPAA